jgi:hypothetical protein
MDIVICWVMLSMDMPFVAHGYYGGISDMILIVFKTKILSYATVCFIMNTLLFTFIEAVSKSVSITALKTGHDGIKTKK